MSTLKIYTFFLLCIALLSCNSDITPIGKWKVIQLRTKDDDTSQTLKIDLTNSKSISHYTDSIFMDGKFGKLKLDTSSQAIKMRKEVELNFSGLQNTYLTLNSDSSYKLDNQPMLFGFVTPNDSIYRNIIIDKWSYIENEKWLSLRVSSDDNRNYRILKLTKDTLIIDDDDRNIKNGPPIKELTLIRQ